MWIVEEPIRCGLRRRIRCWSQVSDSVAHKSHDDADHEAEEILHAWDQEWKTITRTDGWSVCRDAAGRVLLRVRRLEVP